MYELGYVNSENAEFVFGSNGVYIALNDLFDYEWEEVAKGDRITRFKAKIHAKTVKVTIKCSTKAEGLRKKSELLSVVDLDVANGEAGKLYYGEYYLRCWFNGSSLGRYNDVTGSYQFEAKIICDSHSWIRDYRKDFIVGSGETGGEEDFPLDFPFDFSGAESGSVQLALDGYKGCDFYLQIYGGCKDPIIYVNDYPYQVFCELQSGESLVINSRTLSVAKIGVGGEVANMFNSRSFEHSVFEKMPTGLVTVRWSGEFNFYIIFHIERSEPVWI